MIYSGVAIHSKLYDPERYFLTLFELKTIDSTYSALILAGGKSERMGYPKPWLIHENGITYLEHIIKSYYQTGIKQIIVVLNEAFYSAPWLEAIEHVKSFATIVRNPNPEKGRLYSVFLGFQHISTEKILIHNVDNPNVDAVVVETLIEESNGVPVTIPTYQGKGGHPVIIDQEVKDEIIRAHETYHSLKDVFGLFEKKYVDVSSSSILANINMPSEYISFYNHQKNNYPEQFSIPEIEK